MTSSRGGDIRVVNTYDLDDVRYLLRHLDVSSVDEALAIVTRYFDESVLLPNTRLILEELLFPS